MNPNKTTMDDTSRMPFGKHKNVMLVNVPADYLLWLYKQDWVETKFPSLYRYIEEHEEILIDEAEDQ